MNINSRTTAEIKGLQAQLAARLPEEYEVWYMTYRRLHLD
jgi:hypothetical protein